MIFFKHNLITLAFIIIAVWVLPATSKNLELLKKNCIEILTNCAKFKNNMEDKNKNYKGYLKIYGNKIKVHLVNIIDAGETFKIKIYRRPNVLFNISTSKIRSNALFNISTNTRQLYSPEKIRLEIAANFAEAYKKFIKDKDNELQDPVNYFCNEKCSDNHYQNFLENIFQLNIADLQ